MFDYDLITNITLGAAATVPIIVAIVQAFKMTGWVPDRFAPFLSMFIGVVIAFFLAVDARADWGGTVLTGILFGLSASGLYSGVKTTSHAIKMDRVHGKVK